VILLRIFAIVGFVFALTGVRASAQTFSLYGVSQKVCQLNGQTDWATNTPTIAQTLTNFGMEAADLGAPVDTGAATLYFLFGDTRPNGHSPGSMPEVPPDDSVGMSSSSTPPTSTTCLGLQVETVTSAPPTLVRPTITPAIDQGSFNVPTGGVYVGTSLYEFFWTNHCLNPGILVPSPTDPLVLPTTPPPWPPPVCPESASLNSIGISVLGQSVGSSDVSFSQPMVGGTAVTMPSGFVYVNAVDATHLPNLAPSYQQLGIFITGVPRYRASVPYLAYATAANIGDPSQWMFFNGLSGSSPNWISRAAWESKHDAKGLWVPPSSSVQIYNPSTSEQCIGEHSLTWNAPLNVWLLLYGCSGSVEARYAPAPWGPWSEPIVLLSVAHDPGLYCTLLQNATGCLGLTNYQLFPNGKIWPGVLYAPFVLSRFTRDVSPPGPHIIRRARIYWLVSTWNPYVVVVMQSTLQLTAITLPTVGGTLPQPIPPIAVEGPITPTAGSPVEGELVLNTTIAAIDTDNLLLTFTDPVGNAITLKVAPDLLRRVKVNEPVTIRYTDAVVTALGKADAMPPNDRNDSNTIEVVATVADVDYGNRAVTVPRQNGTLRSVKVGPNVQGLDAVHRGDRVVMLLTRPVVIDIRPRAVSALPFEPGINRLGADYRSFSSRDGPQDCQVACGDDDQCRAWTYVREGVQGPAARCWLKRSVPPPTRNDCCVSGVIR
jgi:hypothetical protein